MFIARIIYPVEVLGPGKRIGIWFEGCPRRCKGCSNPELWVQQNQHDISTEHFKELILEIANQKKIDGFTFTGGDPLFQPRDFLKAIAFCKEINADILVYTGYIKDEIDQGLLKDVAVLIDGPYVERLNDGALIRGSSNQNVYILNPLFQNKYDEYFSKSRNQIQNIVTDDGVISLGIHNRDFSL